MEEPPLNVLLVEDDLSAALLFRCVAEKVRGNARLAIAENGQKAIDYLAGKGPYANRAAYPIPDLVILDLLMPGLSGFDVLDWRQSQQNLLHIPIVVFSGSVRDQDKEQALAKGAISFVPKPADLPQLKTAISEMLRLGARAPR